MVSQWWLTIQRESETERERKKKKERKIRVFFLIFQPSFSSSDDFVPIIAKEKGEHSGNHLGTELLTPFCFQATVNLQTETSKVSAPSQTRKQHKNLANGKNIAANFRNGTRQTLSQLRKISQLHKTSRPCQFSSAKAASSTKIGQTIKHLLFPQRPRLPKAIS